MKKGLLLSIALIISLLASFRLSAVAVSDLLRRSSAPGRLGPAVRLAPDLAENYHHIGQTKHYSLTGADLAEAERHYRRAIALNPLYSPAWFDLAQARLDAGDKDEAVRLMDIYSRLNPANTDRIWNIAKFHLVGTRDMDRAVLHFRRFAALAPREDGSVFELLAITGLTPDYLIKNFFMQKERLYTNYLLYLVRTKKTEKALQFWNSARRDYFSERAKLKFCNLLMDKGHYAEASAVWYETAPEYAGSALSNGGFEHDSRNACLDWRFDLPEGVDAETDKKEAAQGISSLRLEFDGTANPDLAVRQLVPVRPGGRYLLRAKIKTGGLTTANGVFLDARGHRCGRVAGESRVFTGTNPWTEVRLDFYAPPDCTMIEVALKRVKSGKFNNKISGRAWLDAVEIMPAE